LRLAGQALQLGSEVLVGLGRGPSPVQPLRIVDQAHQRAVLGHLRQQAEHGQADQETIRRRPRLKTERRPERITLRTRQPPEAIQHRPHHLVQAGERQLHLRLHPTARSTRRSAADSAT
jgi:hypothetical protein